MPIIYKSAFGNSLLKQSPAITERTLFSTRTAASPVAGMGAGEAKAGRGDEKKGKTIKNENKGNGKIITQTLKNDLVSY